MVQSKTGLMGPQPRGADCSARRRHTAAADPYGAICDKAADGLRQAGAFGEPERWRYEWERRYTRDEWLDQLPTQGGHVRFTPDELAEILTGVGAAIDELGGAFTMSFTTVAVTAARAA